METNLHLNKNLYKIFLGITKYTPITLSIVFILYLTSNYLKIPMPVLEYIGGTSIIFLIFLFLIGKVFHYCYIYRIPLYYIISVHAIGMINEIITLPISNMNMFRLYFILTGIFFVIYIWYEYKNKHKTRPG